MKSPNIFYFIFAFYLLGITHNASWSQVDGKWQGLLIKSGETPDKGQIIYLEINTKNELIARTREEIVGKEAYAVKKCKGSYQKGTLNLKQTVVEKKKDASGVRWCNLDFELAYIDSTGYLTGTFKSTDCRGMQGKIICFASTIDFTTDPTIKEIQSWRPIFVDDLKHNRKAPIIRNEERKNFHFQPIYFDYDKTEIKPEFDAFLQAMIKVVLGHTDLRIKVTGHTDADGSDSYNIDLSQRRAQALIDYFVKNGIAKDRIVIDFKGEKEPVGDNHTELGKQLNRRVDFSFI